MANPYVREIGSLADIDGVPLAVGVDYDCVVIGDRRLDAGQAEEFARLLIRAVWEASWQRGASGG